VAGTDDKISVQALSAPGFELQWTSKLDSQPRGAVSARATASGVTLFVPLSLVTGSSNNVYAIVTTSATSSGSGTSARRSRTDRGLPRRLSAGATRIARLDGTVPSFLQPSADVDRSSSQPRGRARAGRAGRGAASQRRPTGDPSPHRAPPRPLPSAVGRGAAAPPQAPGGRGGQPDDRIPGSPRRQETAAAGALSRPSGVGYVITSDGMLHVLGLQAGKDLQRPASFLPANARWSSPIAVDTTLYAATSSGCGGAPNGIWATDLDSETKPVVSWKTNGGPVVGAVAFAPDGTLFAAVGAGQATADGKANAIVALDPKTLRLKDWFTQPAAEFVTGPTIIRHGDRDILAAATKDGRILLLDAKSLGGADHATPLHASKTWLGPSGGQRGCARNLAAAAAFRRRHELDSVAGRRRAGDFRAIDQRCDPVRRRDRPEAGRQRRGAFDGAGMGLS
jgi:hypothetical protein